jgi:DNA invertase Pin-like site-specific DNA recombinase
MAKERTSVRMQAQIKLMSEQGYSIRAIARTLKIARKTVRRIFPINSRPSPPTVSRTRLFVDGSDLVAKSS